MKNFDAGVNLVDAQLDGPFLVDGPHNEGQVSLFGADGQEITVRDKIIEHAKEAGMAGILLHSKEPRHWNDNFQWCDKYRTREFLVSTTLGIHPKYVYQAYKFNNPEEIREGMFAKMVEMARDRRVAAIGIIGLDYSNPKADKEKQKQVFIRQVDIAADVGKPVIFFVRDAHADFLSIMAPLKHKYPELQGVVHCFTGTSQEMREYLDLGLYIGITGWLTQNWRNHDLRQAIRRLPMDRVIFATDTPYLCPPLFKEDYGIHRSQPDAIGYVVARFARERRMEYEDVAKTVLDNTRRLFRIKLRS